MSLDEILKHVEPVRAVPPMGEGARELLDEITATPRETARTRRRVPRAVAWWPRRRFTVMSAAGLAAVAVAVSWVVPGFFGPAPAAALDIRKEGGYYVVTVTDAFADAERYQAQLRGAGLDVELRVEPVSPSLVGTVFEPYDPRKNGLSAAELSRRDDLVQSIESPGRCAASRRCTIGVRVPVGYRAYKGPEHRGPARIMLGRRARPGERHIGFAPLDNPGEPLQCTRFVNRTVGEVRAMLRAHGVTVARFAVPLRGARSSVPVSWYVHGGWLTEPGKALLIADQTRTRTPDLSEPKRCPGTS
ncbi:hypothetical protein D0T12_20765 [Actinomadura spongiicola]|uniref:Uncharacterized protein n=1 Tax=Actinomadura spongiicola TaxID=2303421 RepID=A0A372GEE5_9ACTN|nr:hypothetical protein [Actinomadura spongiicola]RFS83479.1 hypothetical protein D0T12_20765 [Actinomadura spongiicola]